MTDRPVSTIFICPRKPGPLVPVRYIRLCRLFFLIVIIILIVIQKHTAEKKSKITIMIKIMNCQTPI